MHAPRLPYGVSSRMEALGAAAASERHATSSSTLIVTAFLLPESGSSTHGKGSLGPLVSSNKNRPVDPRVLFKLVDKFTERSPGLCDANVTLLVLHNLRTNELLPEGPRHRRFGVEYLRTSLSGSLRLMSPLNARFVLLDRLLARARWDCAYSVDLSDVDILRAPPCAALHASELVIGTDACSPKMRKWLGGRMGRSGMLRNDSGHYSASAIDDTFWGGKDARDLLSRGRGGCIYSAALVGGRRSAFGPALRNVTAQLTANYARRRATKHGLAPNGAVQYWAEDMVAWNLLAQDLPHGHLLTGYPYGPTNLPMYGGLSVEHLDPFKTVTAAERPPQCWGSERCRQQWQSDVGGMYWFGHKMPASWRYLLMEPACRRNRTLISTGRRKGAFEGWFWKIPRRSCALPRCSGGAPLVLNVDVEGVP